MGKKIAVQQASTHAQRARLLERLQRGPVDAITASSELNVLQPATRVNERRETATPSRPTASPVLMSRATSTPVLLSSS